MYAQKYDEEFVPHLPSFVTAVWNLLTSTGAEVKYDMVCLNVESIIFIHIRISLVIDVYQCCIDDDNLNKFYGYPT